MSSSTAQPTSKQLGPVTGLSIFWPVLTLALASCLHPLGSVCGESFPRYRYYFRALPLSGLLDSLYFLSHCVKNGSTAAVIARLHENEPDMLELGLYREQEGSSVTLDRLDRFLNSFFDLKIRIFPNIFIILVYTKLCTIAGAPWSLLLGTIYLSSWLIVEAILVVELLSRRRKLGRDERYLPEQARQAVLNPGSGGTGVFAQILHLLNHFIIVAQVIGFITIMTMAIVQERSALVPQQPQSTLPPSKTVSSLWSIYFFIRAYLVAPLRGVNSIVGSIISGFKHQFPKNWFLAIIYVLFVILPIGTIVSIVWGCTVVAQVLFIFFACMFALYLLTLFIVAPPVGTALGFRYAYRHPGVLLRVFAFLLLGGSLAYYIKFFDPTGTSKRSWSDFLG